MSTAPEPSNLPDWMIIFAFLASLVLTIFKVLEGIFKAVRKSNLEIALTREVFFRILETGEALYLNAVLVAYDVGALITDINASLKKEDGATKEFIMNVAQIGEKFRSTQGLYQFSFHSSSPLAFIPENDPQRQVYICEHASYAEATRQEFQSFQQKLFQLKEKYSGISNTDEAQMAQFVHAIKDATNSACASIMDKIQIEAGMYSLTLTVTYRQKGKYLPMFITKKAKSRIQFVVDTYARDMMRYSLNEYLQKKSYQFATNQSEAIATPEYSPSNVVELSAK